MVLTPASLDRNSFFISAIVSETYLPKSSEALALRKPFTMSAKDFSNIVGFSGVSS